MVQHNVAPTKPKICLGAIDLSTMNLPSTAETSICKMIEACPSIDNLKAKDQNLQKQINDLKEIDIARLGQKVAEASDEAKESKQRDAQNQQLLNEVNDNVVMLKSWNTRQESAIKSLVQRVVLDDLYLNFEEWVEAVYIPQCGALENKYSIGHLYLNVNRNYAATQAAYVNIRNPKSTAPCSANDWVLMPGTKRNELLTMVGIDPIEISRVDKHTWAYSLDPVKFQDFISSLKTLDLSKVNVSLGEVYFDPIFKEDATIEENLNVGQKTTTQDLDVKGVATIERATIKKACVEEVTCDTIFQENVNVNQSLTANRLEATGTSQFNNTSLTGSTRVERFDGEVYASDKLRVGDGMDVTGNVNLRNDTTANVLTVTSALNIPVSSNVMIGTKHLEDWLVEFGNQHWQRR